MTELARKPEYLASLREELLDIAEQDGPNGQLRLSGQSVRQAHRLDSFIREVMRLKGDTLSHIRVTTGDISLGKFVIPRGACLS